MIRKIKVEEEKMLLEMIRSDVFQNIYMYIDMLNCGFDGENIETHLCINEDGNIALVIYRYYNSFQVFSTENADDTSYNECKSFIEHSGVSMISGDEKTINNLYDGISNYTLITGGIYEAPRVEDINNSDMYIADISECGEIAELICMDETFAAHYTVEDLTNQLVNRIKFENCKNLILRKDGKIVAHFGTYADCNEVAVMSGLMVHPDCRKNGYGTLMIKELSRLVYEEEKSPVLFCYVDKTADWYLSLGFTLKTKCAKLEKNNN